ncbi:MAG: cytochrome B [Rhodospirillaceae bacterium]|nr:MAG: cytochrome B [Rhodospirillaceae bacterium]
MNEKPLRAYAVWDRPTRWFHWINVLAIVGLMGIGIVLLNAKILGVSTPGKILLKETHVWVGYVFAINLAIRIIWGFMGNRYARWRSILPGGAGYVRSVRDYAADFSNKRPNRYLGHNPLGRLSVAVLFLLLVTQASAGLILAGTDIFYPPFGHWIAEWIAADGVDPASLMPYAKDTYNMQAYQEMRAFRDPVITTHVYVFYGLLAVIVAHVAAVIVTEIREGGSLVSALFTGRKILSGTPVDYEESGDQKDG